jgi:hypothetical protein
MTAIRIGFDDHVEKDHPTISWKAAAYVQYRRIRSLQIMFDKKLHDGIGHWKAGERNTAGAMAQSSFLEKLGKLRFMFSLFILGSNFRPKYDL